MKTDSSNYSCTCRTLRRAAREVTALYDEQFAPIGLLTTQYAVLSAVHRLAPLTISELAEELALDRTTLTRNLECLNRDGLVISGAGRDGRTRQLSLSEAGEARYAEALPLWNEAEQAVASRFGAERLDQLLAGLRELTRVMKENGVPLGREEARA